MAWLSGYSYRKKLTINHSGAIAGYQKRLIIANASGSDSGISIFTGGKCLSWPFDIRFTASDGTTLLDCWREDHSQDSATWWVEYDQADGNTDIYVYYGLQGAADVSSGAATFPAMFEDFDTLDTDIWEVNIAGAGSVTTDGSSVILSVAGANAFAEIWYKLNPCALGQAARMKLQSSTYLDSVLDVVAAGIVLYPNGSHYALLNFSENTALLRGKYYQHDGSNISTIDVVGGYGNAWFVLDIERTAGASNVTYKINNANTVVSSNMVPTIANGPNIWIKTTTTSRTENIKCDWILVRTLTAVEPTVTFAAEEAYTSWLSNYTFRKKLTISHSGAVSGYQKKLTLVKGTGTDSDGTIYLGNNALIWPTDIRFTTDDGTTLLDFWREESDETDGTWWVEYDQADGDTVIYLYTGKRNATDASSGDNTFPQFFDDFVGSSLDLTKWDDYCDAAPPVADSIIELEATVSATNQNIDSKAKFANPVAIRSKWKTDRFADADSNSFIGLWESGSNESCCAPNYFYDGYEAIYWHAGGGVTNYTQGISSWSVNEWHVTEGVFPGAGGVDKWYCDGVEDASYSSNPAIFSTAYVDISVNYYDGPCTAWFDWVLVRTYAPVEPTVSTSTPEITVTPVEPAWLYGYNKRKKLIFTHDGAITGYQKKIALTEALAGAGGLEGNTNNWPYDIRFTAADGRTLLDFWREEADGTDGTWWVEYNQADGDTTVYLYYNGIEPDASSGESTFPLLFDSFDTEVNSAIWDITTTGGTITVTDGIVYLNASIGSNDTRLLSKTSFGTNTALEMLGKVKDLNIHMHGYGLVAETSELLFRYGWPNAGITCRTKSSGSNTDTIITNYAGDYHRWSIKRNGTTSVIYEVDGNVEATHTTNVPGITLPVRLSAYWLQSEQWFDFVFIRTYTDIEPTVTWGDEESVATHQIMTMQSGWAFVALEVPEFSGQWIYKLIQVTATGTSSVMKKAAKNISITAGSVWPGNYAYRKKLTLNHSGAISGYHKKLTIVKGSGADSGDTIYLNNLALAWPNDIRFMDVNDNSLDFWREESDATDGTWWVKYDQADGNTEIHLYVGKASDTDASNGYATFPDLFDDFNDGSLDNDKWTFVASNGGTLTETDGNIYMTALTSNDNCVVRSKSLFGVNKLVRFRSNISHVDNGNVSTAGFVDNATYDDECTINVNGWDADSKYKFYNRTAAGFANAPLSTTANEYHVYEVCRNNGVDNRYSIDDGTETIIDTYVSTAQLNAEWRMWVITSTYMTAYLDWMFVANYDDVEPTVTYGEMEQSGTIVRLAKSISHIIPKITSTTSQIIDAVKEAGEQVQQVLIAVTSTTAQSISRVINHYVPKVTSSTIQSIMKTISHNVPKITSATMLCMTKAVAHYVPKVTGSTVQGLIKTAGKNIVISMKRGYAHSKYHAIGGSADGEQTDYLMKFVVNKGAGTDAAGTVYLNNLAASWTGTVPNDLRFINKDGALLGYWIESSDANTATIWVKIDVIPVAGTGIYLLYGKSGDMSASDESIWDFFDHFTDNMLTANQSALTTDLTGFNKSWGVETFTRVTDAQYRVVGTAALKVDTTGANNNQGVTLSQATTVIGNTYTASVWLCGEGTVKITIQEQGGPIIGNSITLTPTPTRYSLTYTSATGTFGCVSVGVQGLVARTFYASGFQLEQSPSLTPWVIGGITYNTDKWQLTGSPTITVSGSVLEYTDSAVNQYLESKSDGALKNFGYGYAIETLVKDAANLTNLCGYFGFGHYTYNPVTSQYFQRAAMSAIGTYGYDGIVYSAGSTRGFDMYEDCTPTFTRMTIVRRSDYCALLKNDVVKWSATTNIPTAELPLTIGKGYFSNPRKGYWDWIGVRKYTANEPTHGIWSSTVGIAKAIGHYIPKITGMTTLTISRAMSKIIRAFAVAGFNHNYNYYDGRVPMSFCEYGVEGTWDDVTDSDAGHAAPNPNAKTWKLDWTEGSSQWIGWSDFFGLGAVQAGETVTVGGWYKAPADCPRDTLFFRLYYNYGGQYMSDMAVHYMTRNGEWQYYEITGTATLSVEEPFEPTVENLFALGPMDWTGTVYVNDLRIHRNKTGFTGKTVSHYIPKITSTTAQSISRSISKGISVVSNTVQSLIKKVSHYIPKITSLTSQLVNAVFISGENMQYVIIAVTSSTSQNISRSINHYVPKVTATATVSLPRAMSKTVGITATTAQSIGKAVKHTIGVSSNVIVWVLTGAQHTYQQAITVTATGAVSLAKAVSHYVPKITSTTIQSVSRKTTHYVRVTSTTSQSISRSVKKYVRVTSTTIQRIPRSITHAIPKITSSTVQRVSKGVKHYVPKVTSTTAPALAKKAGKYIRVTATGTLAALGKRVSKYVQVRVTSIVSLPQFRQLYRTIAVRATTAQSLTKKVTKTIAVSSIVTVLVDAFSLVKAYYERVRGSSLITLILRFVEQKPTTKVIYGESPITERVRGQSLMTDEVEGDSEITTEVRMNGGI
jgi:hypothetical protein